MQALEKATKIHRSLSPCSYLCVIHNYFTSSGRKSHVLKQKQFPRCETCMFITATNYLPTGLWSACSCSSAWKRREEQIISNSSHSCSVRNELHVLYSHRLLALLCLIHYWLKKKMLFLFVLVGFYLVSFTLFSKLITHLVSEDHWGLLWRNTPITPV